MSISDYAEGRAGERLYVKAEDYARMTAGSNAPRSPVEYRHRDDLPRGAIKLDPDHADYAIHNTDADLARAWAPVSQASVQAHDYLVPYEPGDTESDGE